ncbi:hypothetical protein AX17_003141 [Amanita inopinata Kibby_2008]|nr:hypothetical protein AX17_003141 [Amanita inopinata Kibby_2008]
MLTELEVEAYDYSKPMLTDDVLRDLTLIRSDCFGMLLPKLSSLTFRNCLSGSPGILGLMILSRCDVSEKEGDRLKHFLLNEEQLDADDEECIDEARRHGLTAKIYIGDSESYDRYSDDSDI